MGRPGRSNLRLATLCLPLLLVLAGCAGDSPADSLAATTTSIADDAGTIAGTIVDEELQPVEGAMVGLVQDPKVRSTTDRTGAFSLGGVPAGSQKLLVQKDGYRPESISVTVVPAETATVKLTIKAIPQVPTRQQTHLYDGYLGVDVALPPGNQFGQGTQGANRRSVYYPIEQPNLIGVVAGIQWSPGLPLVSERMHLLVYLNFPPNLCDEAARPHCLPMATTEGKGPLLAGSNDYQENMADRDDLKINVRFKMRSCIRGDVGPQWTDLSRCSTPTEAVQVGLEQRVKAYTTMFYGEAAPADYKPFPE